MNHHSVLVNSTLVELLGQRATRKPQQKIYTFLSDGETRETHLTCEQLEQRARAIGARLQDLQATGKRALLLYPPGLEYIAGFFGCLYAGVVAVPVYPPNPARLNRTLPRLQAIMADAQATVALTTTPILTMAQLLLGQAPDLKALHWLATDEIDQALAERWQEPAVSGETLAFLQYTSGSTAAPRGVMLTHHNLLHNLALVHRCFGLTPSSRGMVWLPPYHDMGLIGGILQPLYGGFPIVLMSPIDFLKQPFRWLQAISRYQATTSGGPNFAYDLCVRKTSAEQRATLDLSSWQLAFNGAEPIRHDTLERFAQTFGACGFRKEAFYPCYGLAEATLIASGGLKAAPPVVQTVQAVALGRNRVEAVAPTHPEAQTLISSGRALAEQKIVIVDPDTAKQCAPDQIGEIWLSGPSVAQGYWNQPEKTIQTFQAYLADTNEGPFLRTGDLGFLHDGELYVTGRIKDLIIIRGRNHYPQDIEQTVEQSHPALRPGCSAAFSVDIDGEERLIVAQEIRRQATDVNLDDVIRVIRQAVAEAHELQVYGVLLLQEQSLPKTSSGKIQRHACRAGFVSDSLDVVAKNILQVSPPSESSSQAKESFISKALTAVQEPTARCALLTLYLQEQIAGILRLTSSQIDTQQPLNSFGIDSLMAIELKNQIQVNLGVELPMSDFFQGLSISQLASEILARFEAHPTSPETGLVPATEPQTEYPLSYGQQALWFLYQLAPQSAAYNVPSAVRIRSALNVPALQRAFERLVARHPSLRTTFAASTGGGVQRVHANLDFDFQVTDASDWCEADLNQFLAEKAHQPFDLEKGPLLRVHVFERSAQEYVLLVTMHHIITDFWSLAILVDELRALYSTECSGQAMTLPPLELQYTDYARWQTEMLAGPQGEQLWGYWEKQLAGELPLLNLFTDHPRPPVQTYNGSVYTMRLGSELARRLKDLSSAHKATLNMTLLAAFQVLLHRYTGQEDLLVGSVAAGRSQAELAGIVGYFVNPIVLRARPSAKQTFTDFLAQTRQTVLDAFQHQDYPFNLLVDRLQPLRDYSRSPLFQVMFVFQRAYKLHEQGLTPFSLNVAEAQAELGGLRLESMALRHQVAQFDLTLTMGEAGEELIALFEYNTDLFEADTIVRMATHFQTLLEEITTDPQRRLENLMLLPEAEWCQLLDAWQSSRMDCDHALSIQTLFEAQAKRTPDTIAVVFANQQITYRQLDQRADQLAAHLRELGVKSEVFVGLYMERSLEMIVGVLGILKAGGAYIPLDPTYPQERLRFMLTDARVSVLLAQTHLRDKLPQCEGQIVYLDRDWGMAVVADQIGAERMSGQVTGQNSACVIYTSGSTGRPKGVVLQHGGIVNLINSFIHSYHPTMQDKMLPLTSVSSASFVGEILPLLCVGGTLVLPQEGELLDQEELFDLIARHGISIISTVPTVIAALNARKDKLSRTRLILSGGEALVANDVDRLLDSVTIANGYGLTETTICSTFYNLEGKSFEASAWVPIGRPIINTEVYVLDSSLNCIPIGCSGELYVGGDGLARGYYANPALTAERFIPNPYRPGERMYRTGDIGRWLPNGAIEYLHRADDQVKIRGFRIEIGEVESTIKRHPAVKDAFVMAREDTPGDKRLAAYIVSRESGLSSGALHQWLTDRLPVYMVPAAFEMMDSLPLTPHSKVDVKALPTPGGDRPSLETTYIAPQSETERTIASIWQEILKMEKVGIHDNFFELGGNSLLIARVHRRLCGELGFDLSLVDMFKYPTVSSLASSQQKFIASSLDQVKEVAKRRKTALDRRQQLVKSRLRSLE